MHNAPSVSYPVGRCRFEAMLMLGLCGLATGIAGVWSFAFPFTWQHAMVWGVLAACGAFGLWRWRRTWTGEIRWDAGAWSWVGCNTVLPGRLSVALDLQSILLARCSSQGRWLWLEARHRPLRWGDLRRAVYSRAVDDALQQPGGRSEAGIAS